MDCLDWLRANMGPLEWLIVGLTIATSSAVFLSLVLGLDIDITATCFILAAEAWFLFGMMVGYMRS